MIRRPIPLLALVALAAVPAAAQVPRGAERLDRTGLPNLHRVSPALYRGAQPTAEGVHELARMGIRTIVSLRSLHSDRRLLAGTGLSYLRIPMQTWNPEEEDVVLFLRIAADPDRQPVFVHCQRGADRTGVAVAAWRVAVEGWTADDAVREMTRGDYGFEPLWRGLVAFVRGFDREALRRAAGLG